MPDRKAVPKPPRKPAKRKPKKKEFLLTAKEIAAVRQMRQLKLAEGAERATSAGRAAPFHGSRKMSASEKNLRKRFKRKKG